MSNLLKIALSLSVMSFSLQAVAQEKPTKPTAKPPVKAQPAIKAKPTGKSPRDIKAFFKDAEKQARDMPEGCKPQTHPEPQQTKPIA